MYRRLRRAIHVAIVGVLITGMTLSNASACWMSRQSCQPACSAAPSRCVPACPPRCAVYACPPASNPCGNGSYGHVSSCAISGTVVGGCSGAILNQEMPSIETPMETIPMGSAIPDDNSMRHNESVLDFSTDASHSNNSPPVPVDSSLSDRVPPAMSTKPDLGRSTTSENNPFRKPSVAPVVEPTPAPIDARPAPVAPNTPRSDPATPPAGTDLFGAPTTPTTPPVVPATPAAEPDLFGAPATPATPAAEPDLFGTPATPPTPAMPAAEPDLFGTPATPPTPATPAAEPDLFGTPATPPTPATPAAEPDLFGTPATPPTPATPAAEPDLFGTPDTAANMPAEPTPAPEVDLFGGPTPASTATAPANDGLSDLFNDPVAAPGATGAVDSPAKPDPAGSDTSNDLFKGLFGTEGASNNDGGSASLLANEPVRVWNDNTGSYRTMGRLIRVSADYVRLDKLSGNSCTVPLRRLSATDMAYVTDVLVALNKSDEATKVLVSK